MKDQDLTYRLGIMLAATTQQAAIATEAGFKAFARSKCREAQAIRRQMQEA